MTIKVAFVSQPFESVVPPVQGGSLAIWTYQVVRRLAPYGDFIVYSRRSRSQQKEQQYEGVRYRRVEARPDDYLLKPYKLLERLLRFPNATRPSYASPLCYLGYILQIARDIKVQGCDIVHIHNFSQFVPIIRYLNPQAKIVLHMGCEWLTQLNRAMIERRLRQTHVVIGCSDYLTEKVRNRFPEFAHRCHTILNGVDPANFSTHQASDAHHHASENGTQRLLFVGRVSPEKGVHVLLEAFRKVVEQCPSTQLDIVGPGGNLPYEYIVLVSDDEKVASLASFYDNVLRQGDYYAYLRRQLPAELARHVNFVGPIPHSRIASYYQRADILVNPSFSESFGMSLVEAMASGLPVVATRVGGMTGIVKESETGLLVESGDVAALTDALLTLLTDGEKRKAMGAAGRQLALERYTWEQVSNTLLEQYQRVRADNG